MAWIARIDAIHANDPQNLAVHVTYYDDTVPVGQDGLPIPQLTTTLMLPTNVSAAAAQAKIIEVGQDARSCYVKTNSLQSRVGTLITVP